MSPASHDYVYVNQWASYIGLVLSCGKMKLAAWVLCAPLICIPPIAWELCAPLTSIPLIQLPKCTKALNSHSILWSSKKDQEFQKGSIISKQLNYFNQWNNFPPFFPSHMTRTPKLKPVCNFIDIEVTWLWVLNWKLLHIVYIDLHF